MPETTAKANVLKKTWENSSHCHWKCSKLFFFYNLRSVPFSDISSPSTNDILVEIEFESNPLFHLSYCRWHSKFGITWLAAYWLYQESNWGKKERININILHHTIIYVWMYQYINIYQYILVILYNILMCIYIRNEQNVEQTTGNKNFIWEKIKKWLMTNENDFIIRDSLARSLSLSLTVCLFPSLDFAAHTWHVKYSLWPVIKWFLG